MEHLIECTCGFKQEGEDPKELGMDTLIERRSYEIIGDYLYDIICEHNDIRMLCTLCKDESDILK